MALDDKLAELAQLFPGLDPQALAAMPEAALVGLPAELLPEKLTGEKTETEADGLLLTATPGLAEVLKGVPLSDGEGKEAHNGSCSSWCPAASRGPHRLTLPGP